MVRRLSLINKVYLLLVIVAVICTVVLDLDRAKIERGLDSVDLVIDFEELEQLAEQSEHDVSWWLEHFHSLGFENVALKERTFENLLNYGMPMTAMMRNEWLQTVGFHRGISGKTRDKIESGDRFDYIVTIEDSFYYEEIKKALLDRYPKEFMYFDDDFHIIVFDGKPEDALYLEGGLLKDEEGKSKRSVKYLTDSKIAWMGFGFWLWDIENIKNAGMKPLLRPSNFPRYSDNLIDAFDRECKKYDCNPEYIVFQGDSVLGYDLEMKKPNNTYRYMQDNNIAVGLVESGVQRGHSKQKGAEDLAKMLNYNAVRVFPIVGYIQKRYKWYGYEDAQEIENTLYRAITERNIRSIYFRPFREKDNDVVYITDWEPYKKMFTRLEKRLLAHNIRFGKASYMKLNMPYPLFIAGISYGIIAMGMFLFTRYIWIADRLKWIIFIIAIALSTIASFLIPNVWALLFGILTSIVVPTFAAAMLCIILNCLRFKQCKKCNKFSSLAIIKRSIGAYLFIGIILTLGGLSLGAVLSHSDYLLEIEYFRGVKASQLVPLILFVGLFILEMGASYYEDKYSNWRYVKNLLANNIKIMHLIILAVVGAVGIIYIARTGHETKIQPSSVEMLIRNALEMGLLARPRTKEMFIAFPALYILLNRFARKKQRGAFVLGFISMLGFTSVLNTFSHLRTPLYISIARTFYSLVFGLIIGSISIIIISLIVRAFNKYTHMYKSALNDNILAKEEVDG